MLRLLVIALCAYALIVLFALVFAERVMFQPPASSYAPGPFPFVRVPVGSGDSLAVVYLPNADARYTILHSHGNAEDLGHVLPALHLLHSFGFAVLGYDYRGYGESRSGPPTARKAVEDAEAVYRYAVEELAIPSDRLILYGSSVGSGPAFELAVRHDPAGLILQGAFTSAFRVITRVTLLPFDRYPNLTHLREVSCPVLVIHGTRDFIVPWSHGRRLFSEAAEPKQALWVEGAGHNDLVQIAGPRLGLALKQFARLVDDHNGGK